MKQILNKIGSKLALGLAAALPYLSPLNHQARAQEAVRLEQADPMAYTNNAVYRGWVENLERGKKIARENPDLIGKLVDEAISYDPQEDVRDFFSFPKGFTKKDLLMTARATIFSAERVPDILKHSLYQVINVRDSKGMAEDALFDTGLIRKTSRFKRICNDLFDIDEDCKLLSSAYAANCLGRLRRQEEQGVTNNIPIEIETGIAYTPEYPKGFGHQWVNVNGKVVDPWVELVGKKVDPLMSKNDYSASNRRYIPITSLNVSSKSVNPRATKIYCFPRKY